MKDKRYHLLGKKQLLRMDSGIEVAIVDVSECSIERPKKTKKLLFRQEETTYPQSTTDCGVIHFTVVST